MRLFNLGNKDEHGRQRRIEHRGRYLRASRTGGVALRAQAKAAGLTFTGNTARGARVSATPARNTQVALQNGRLMLRGRYTSGPLRLNLSKSGLSLSARNALGSFNLSNPLRSSAKVAGVQVRGRTAAIMQGIYMVFMLVVVLAKAAVVVGLIALRVVLFLLGLVLRGGVAIPVVVCEWRRRREAERLERLADAFEADRFDDWTPAQWVAATLLMVGAWGRGEAATHAVDRFEEGLHSPADGQGLGVAPEELREVAAALDAIHESSAADGDHDLAVVIVAARRLAEQLPEERLAEVLLDIDERVIAAAPRTRLQDRMLEVFADAAGLRVEPGAEGEAAAGEPSDAASEQPDEPAVDLNTADFEALQTIPHVGPERARAIMAMRPIDGLELLQELDGIGPKRLEEIHASGAGVGGGDPA